MHHKRGLLEAHTRRHVRGGQEVPKAATARGQRRGGVREEGAGRERLCEGGLLPIRQGHQHVLQRRRSEAVQRWSSRGQVRQRHAQVHHGQRLQQRLRHDDQLLQAAATTG